MPTLEEVTAWSGEELEAEARHLLPEGWGLSYEQGTDGWWRASIFDAEQQVVWADSHADPRHLLLNAYGWLLVRGQQPTDPQWRRRRELSPRAVRGDLGLRGVTIPDPEDLDPSEVRAVYGERSNHSKEK